MPVPTLSLMCCVDAVNGVSVSPFGDRVAISTGQRHFDFPFASNSASASAPAVGSGVDSGDRFSGSDSSAGAGAGGAAGSGSGARPKRSSVSIWACKALLQQPSRKRRALASE
jgi:hypothetical protein